MIKALPAMLLFFLITALASAQDLNKVVFGPLEEDEAGVLTVLNEQEIEIEMWVRTDQENPAPIVGVTHCLMSADTIIASRNGAVFNPDYDYPCWDTFVTPPYGHPDDPDIPEGHTFQAAGAIYTIFDPPCEAFDTNGEWDYYGAFLMTCNTGVPVDSVHYPFSAGWFPHSGQGTSWAFEAPPGGGIEPEQDYCGLHFVPECDYIYGDPNHNGVPWELPDVIWMIGLYRGTVEPAYTCYCPPYGDDYAPGADPNGNCVPFELSDVVFMIRPPDWPPYGCPDCPPSWGVNPGKGADENFVPNLKSKVKDKRGSFPE